MIALGIITLVASAAFFLYRCVAGIFVTTCCYCGRRIEPNDYDPCERCMGW